MLEHADRSEMRVSVKSLDVASASGRVAELFRRNRFGCAAVGMAGDRHSGAAEVACGGAASHDGRRTTVCGNKSRSGSGELEQGNETCLCCEQYE